MKITVMLYFFRGGRTASNHGMGRGFNHTRGSASPTRTRASSPPATHRGSSPLRGGMILQGANNNSSGKSLF